MMGGKKPLSKKVIKLRGEKDYKRPNKDKTLDEQVKASEPDMPDFLDEEGQKEWGRVTGWLRELGILTKFDRGVIARKCQNWSSWVMATKKVIELGPVRETKNGFVEQNPYFQIASKAWEQLNKIDQQLGLTPSIRNQMRASLPDKPKKSKEESFFD
jgi:P27 family predicted phage terminase small subunit